PMRGVDAMPTHLDERTADPHARDDLARNGAGGHPHRGLARGLASAAAIVAHAVFYVVGVIGMAGPVLILDVGIVLAALIDIIDDERDRRAGGHLLTGRFILEYAREDPDCVGLLTLGGEA